MVFGKKKVDHHRKKRGTKPTTEAVKETFDEDLQTSRREIENSKEDQALASAQTSNEMSPEAQQYIDNMKPTIAWPGQSFSKEESLGQTFRSRRNDQH